MTNNVNLVDKQSFLTNWLGHRNLTRMVIEAFPEKELMNFSIGGMRTFFEMSKELLAIAVPGLKEIVHNTVGTYNENLENISSKADLLAAWDAATLEIPILYSQITDKRMLETHNLFGQFDFAVFDNLTYFLENEIHHRGQGYVYLRALGIQPPFFWER